MPAEAVPTAAVTAADVGPTSSRPVARRDTAELSTSTSPAAPPTQAPTLLTLLAGALRDFQRTFFNVAPYARAQRAVVELEQVTDVSDPIRLAARDFDQDPLIFSLVDNRGPQHGTVVFDQASGTFTYNPDDAFARTGGTDSFTYKVSDHAGGWHLPDLISFLTRPDFGHADIATVTITMVGAAVDSGLDLSWVDTDTRPQDDLFGYLHGRWLAGHEIPADRSLDNYFRAVKDLTDGQIRDLITELGQSEPAHGTDAQRIGDFFASFMDTETLSRVGVQPLLDELAAIENTGDRDALTAVLGSLARTSVPGGFGTVIGPDAKDSSRNVLQFYQSGLGLPDETFYRDPRYADILAAYPGHIAKMFALTYGGSADDYTATAAHIVALETRLAAAHWDSVKSRDAELTYNPMQFDDLARSAPGFDWAGWLTAYGVAPEQLGQVIVAQPDYLTAFADAWATEPLEDWQDWARWKVIHERASMVTEDLGDENFAFYATLLSGTEQRSERWKRGISWVNDLMGEPLGRLWVEQHFPPEAKQRMETMVANLLGAYRTSINELDWMSAETRIKALEKLDKITVKIGYPDQWRDYSGLEIVRDDFYGNYLRGMEFNTASTLAKLGQAVDRGAWGETPQTVNAYYDLTRNEIVFPAGILQAPFFDLDADDAVNYGAIGAIIGHEIGHAFDDQGSKFDGDGNLVNWWTDADRAEFTKRANALIAQYSQYSPRQLPDTYHVNGALTIGENIGDQGGLAIALKAYELSLGGTSAPVIDGFTGVQRVFLGWAQEWRVKFRDGELIQMLNDPHAPQEFRVNGTVRNLDAFYEAFGVGPGDALYLSPEERVRIWT